MIANTASHQIIKRTFEAKEHPKGSEKRKELNLSVETSEYYPSQKWIVKVRNSMTDGSPHPTQPFVESTYRTNLEARQDVVRRNLGIEVVYK